MHVMFIKVMVFRLKIVRLNYFYNSKVIKSLTSSRDLNLQALLCRIMKMPAKLQQ